MLGALVPAEERWNGDAVILVKPQFEAGREHVGKGGIVRDPEAQQLAVSRVEGAVVALGGQALSHRAAWKFPPHNHTGISSDGAAKVPTRRFLGAFRPGILN